MYNIRQALWSLATNMHCEDAAASILICSLALKAQRIHHRPSCRKVSLKAQTFACLLISWSHCSQGDLLLIRVHRISALGAKKIVGLLKQITGDKKYFSILLKTWNSHTNIQKGRERCKISQKDFVATFNEDLFKN